MIDDATGTDCVRYRREGWCAVITIDRPEARNAVSPDVARGIEAALDLAEQDDDVRALVLTGTPPVFCAGADLKAIGDGRVAELNTERGGFGGLVQRTRTKPLIAAVEGAALAGGTELVLACDLVVAASGARFGIPEVKRGLVAGAGGLFRFGERIPLNLAMECALTGDPIDAEAAHRHGLVNRLTAPGEALAEALRLAETIAANAPVAVRESRTVVRECTGGDESASWRQTEHALARVLATEDLAEGVAAFVEKRPPQWKGR